MANNLKARPIADEIFSKMQELGFSKVAAYAFRDAVVRSDLVMTNLGLLQNQAVDFTQPYTNKNQDNVPNGSIYQRAPLYVGSTIAVENGNFESSAALPVPGWDAFANGVLSYETINPQSGNRSLIVTPTGQNDGAISTRRYQCSPGDAFRITCFVFQSGANDAVSRLIFFDKNDVQISFIQAFTPTLNAWTNVFITGIAPANSVYFRIGLQQSNASVRPVKFDVAIVSRMMTSLEVTPINTAGTPRQTTPVVSQTGLTTALAVGSTTWQFGDTIVAYNTGSADPAAFQTSYVTGDDPAYSGGGIPYIPRLVPADANAANGRLNFGKITTTGGGGASSTGAGSGGGGPVGKQALA